ncbi:pseudouridylate synthase 7 homolog isoform X2 [Selaginella moellendorffii]|uniref:pseudouridylate synthase 7 homolog isoform X2 n=1 Tax=Selaginella moellendorffii TaxID=88036 RepID=UPI000D1CBFC5|nr:pseudouridylate synthase 7 homolog isoform X2 [Selaginella moellendorffii]|eukprot:XP_024545318.1 pseudouridylate synthase 7 homolog isoform X2 [Selaginella moellendorffii]
MEEKDVGILCFANSFPGFRAVLKQRYSDFIVNEVDLDGNVVRLTSLTAPPEDETRSDAAAAEFSVASYEAQLDAFKELAGEENARIVKQLLDKISPEKSDDGNSLVETLTPNEDKGSRTKVHAFFRERMPMLITDTVADNRIRVRYGGGSASDDRSGKRNRSWKGKRGHDSKRQRQDGDKFDRRAGNYWPADRHKFCQFYLYKENKTTQSALMIVAQKIGVKAKNMGFAGTKDKRAVTTQRVTVYKHSATQLAALNKALFGIKLGNFSDVVAESEHAIKEAAEGMGNSGFINYYGLQRFGSCGVPTHAIGAKLLQGDWKTAVDLILQEREGEQQAAEESRKIFKTAGPAEALKLMPHHMIAERAILLGLKKDPANYLQAIQNIPRPMRMMYVHSYQSYLWNSAASTRIQKYGVDAVVEGDLVYCQEDEISKEAGKDDVDLEDLVDTDVLEDDACMELARPSRKKVKHVTAEDIASKKYAITDVVLPLVGSTTVYPSNDVADVYNKITKMESIDLKSCTHNVKEFSVEYLTGAYRNLLVKPIDFEWRLSSYSDARNPLTKTDMDLLQDPSTSLPEEDANSTQGPSLLALQLQFTLPTSAYATMAIREVMKMSTSVSVHKLLSQ